MTIELLSTQKYFNQRDPKGIAEVRNSLGKHIPRGLNPHKMVEDEFLRIFDDFLEEGRTYSRTFLFIYFHFVFENIQNWIIEDTSITNLPVEHCRHTVYPEKAWCSLQKNNPDILDSGRYFIFSIEGGFHFNITDMTRPFKMHFKEHERAAFTNFFLYSGPEMFFQDNEVVPKKESDAPYKKVGSTVI